MALQQWALPKLSELLPLDEESLKQIVTYTDTLPDAQAAEHLTNLLGDSPQALEFISSFNARRPNAHRSAPAVATSKQVSDSKDSKQQDNYSNDSEQGKKLPAFAPPSYPPPIQGASVAPHRPHTNLVIEAAHVRARDEVRLTLVYV